jgi:hypothetical protein
MAGGPCLSSAVPAAATLARPDASPVAAAPPASPWMVSPGFDLFFFVFTSIAVLGPYLAAQHYGVTSMTIIAAVAIVANGPHLVSTWTRVYMDRRERVARPIVYYVVPVLLAAGVVYATLQGPRSQELALVRTLLLFWAVWHFTAQNWGILRIYQRKAGEVGAVGAKAWLPRAERALLWLGVLYPMSLRFQTPNLRLFGSKVWYPHVEPWMSHVILAAFITGGVAYLAFRGWQLARGQRVVIMQPLFLAASAFAFYVPFVMIKNGSTAFACAALWHGLQYIGVVWFYNRSKWKGGVSPDAPLVSWVSQPGRWPLYALLLLAMAGATYGVLQLLTLTGLGGLNAEAWAVIMWTSLTFGHYWVDGFIWKLRKPELRNHLGATAAA